MARAWFSVYTVASLLAIAAATGVKFFAKSRSRPCVSGVERGGIEVGARLSLALVDAGRKAGLSSQNRVSLVAVLGSKSPKKVGSPASDGDDEVTESPGALCLDSPLWEMG